MPSRVPFGMFLGRFGVFLTQKTVTQSASASNKGGIRLWNCVHSINKVRTSRKVIVASASMEAVKWERGRVN